MRPPAVTRSGSHEHEQRVLSLIAEGMGNRDIAQRLVRSPRTIEHHVSAVLGKFNATSRMDVVLRLRSEPWLLTAPEASSLRKLGTPQPKNGYAPRRAAGSPLLYSGHGSRVHGDWTGGRANGLVVVQKHQV